MTNKKNKQHNRIKRCFLLLVNYSMLFQCTKQYKTIPGTFVTSAKVSFKAKDGNQVETTLLFSVPKYYTPKKSHPLLVALHGTGSNATAFHDLWKATTDSLDFILLTPQGENKTIEGIGWRWGDNAERCVLSAIDLVRNTVRVDPKRIYVAGFSSGGRLAYYLGLKYSHRFRGLAALSATLDEQWIPLAAMNKLKVYIGHGSLEEKIAAESRQASIKLRALGIDINYNIYPDIDHDLPEPKEFELQKILNYFNSN